MGKLLSFDRNRMGIQMYLRRGEPQQILRTLPLRAPATVWELDLKHE
jgi:hypothetical protein